MHIDLPLHGGKCPPWLFEKMTKLAEKFLILFTKEEGIEKLLEKLSHPLWFQSLGCYLGFDWHSSGLTTVVGGVLNQALKNINYEIGLYVSGGKGTTAIQTPQKIENLAYKFNLTQYRSYIQVSKLIAKIDNNLLQDRHNLYFHQIFFDGKGNYAIIQQGINSQGKTARRYHRHKNFASKAISLLENKNSGLTAEELKIIASKKEKQVLNLISTKSTSIRQNIVQLIQYIQKHYKMPDHHRIQNTDFNVNKLVKALTSIRHNIDTFKDLLKIQGIGPKAIFNIVQAAELIYGNQADRSDPARFSFTHGGKDGTPYKPKPEEFDESIYNLKILIEKAKIRINAKKIFFSIYKQEKLF